MINLFKYLKKREIIGIIFSIALVVLQVWLELSMPDYMSEITRLVQTDGSLMSDILIAGGKMCLCAFGSLIASIVVCYLASNIASSFATVIRSKIFDKISKFSIAEMKKFSTSSLITRTTNDVTQVDMVIGLGLQMLVKAPIMAVWAILKILDKGIEWSILTGVCVVILLLTVSIILIIVLPRFETVQKLIDRINGVTRENLTGIRVIRAFNAEKFQTDRFNSVNEELTNQQMFNQKTFATMMPVMNLVMHSLTLGIYIIGTILIMNAGLADRITLFSNMIVFSSYGMQVIMSFLMLAMIFMMAPRASISARRINEVLNQDISIVDGDFDGKTDKKGVVEFKNVSFKYPDADEYLLKNISFKANQGETVAFIGSTGSGKSTLINLIPRFYDTTDGTVLVDGIDVKKYKQVALNNKIGYVPQKAVMFTGSVIDNVAFGKTDKEITEDNVKTAIKVAQAENFVSEMEDGVNSHIARGGTNISGGQKQRLSIARAIARDPEIYIFDDTFSALDYKTDSILRSELKKHTKNATNIIVAQRIGTIMNADKIIVLDKGECVGMGTHQELMKNCSLYKEIALSQLSEEEL
ncbi:MAG: ABC transporter ATP-binding protein [Bacilli bacterium]|nr:ABC transporter ATP-binding protein [Bacilli bacterium]